MHTLQQQSATDATRATVFDIPLLVDLIARHLSSVDIYRCTLVSRHFHNAFQHCLYSGICIHQMTTLRKFSSKEATSAFPRHISSVREVSTTFGACVTHLVKCLSPQAPASTPTLFRNLSFFEFHPKLTVAVNEDSVLSLLEASPALQVVHFSGFRHAPDPLFRRLANIIRRKGRRLREFRLSGPRIGNATFCTLLWSCAAVEVLRMDLAPETRGPITHSAERALILRALAREALVSNGSQSHLAQVEATAMTEFWQHTDRIEFAWKDLGRGDFLTRLGTEIVLDLLQMCPFLERLSIPRLTEQSVFIQLAPVMATSIPYLRHLDFNHIGNHVSAATRLMQSCKNLNSLVLSKLHFDSSPLVDALISGHGHSLQCLKIQKSTALSSQQLTLILSNCPHLISLYAVTSDDFNERHAPVLNTKDMAMVPAEPAWGCKDLKTLHLRYKSMGTFIGIPEALRRQIGQLSKLKHLRLHRYGNLGRSFIGEKVSVKQAVTSWTALTDLKRLEFGGLDAFVDEGLEDQARKQWPNLEWLAMHNLQQQLENESTRATVFDIPLLVDLIARHLSSVDIYRCTLVSRYFHNVFQHCLYSCIYIHQMAALRKFSSREAASAFPRHISSVREVSTTFGACVTHLVKCLSPQAPDSTPTLFRNLMVFEFHPKLTVTVNEDSVLSLLEASPALQAVHLSGFRHASDPLIRSLAKIIRRKGRSLREFRLSGPRIGNATFCTLLWSCAAVEVLRMDLAPETRGPITHSAERALILRALAREALVSNGSQSHLAQAEATATTEFWQNTDRIEFAWKDLGRGDFLTRLGTEIALDLLQMCPYLERLSIPRLTMQSVFTQLAPVMATSMPHLQHLDFTHIGNHAFAATRLMQSCKNLNSLVLNKLHFDASPLLDALISGHGRSLQSLNIQKSTALSSQQLTLILSNCPHLISLYAVTSYDFSERYAPLLSMKDMAMVPEESAWSCRDLEILHLGYKSMGTFIGIPEALRRLIGQLSKLTHLKLRRYGNSGQSFIGEKVSVSQAVTSWTALKDLKQLEFGGLDAFVDEGLEDQARKQWPNLEWVRLNDAWP
ncbi:hypothetical protein EC968_001666 [Mortierella alpina]|nr:hypothetical protein EC968_001666 [Mortierella alpina]